MAKREAQARRVVSAGDPIARAEHALAVRAEEFTRAAEAFRAEIASFEKVLADSRELPPGPGLKLVSSRQTAEVEAVGDDAARPTPSEIAEFMRTHQEQGGDEPRPKEPAAPPAQSSDASTPRPRDVARQRLYADIGGAIIGVSAAAAVINFVIL